MREIDFSRLAFDSILVRKSEAGYNPLPIETFLDLPVDQRIELIMEKRIRFFMEEVEVPVYTAISSLDEARR